MVIVYRFRNIFRLSLPTITHPAFRYTTFVEDELLRTICIVETSIPHCSNPFTVSASHWLRFTLKTQRLKSRCQAIPPRLLFATSQVEPGSPGIPRVSTLTALSDFFLCSNDIRSINYLFWFYQT